MSTLASPVENLSDVFTAHLKIARSEKKTLEQAQRREEERARKSLLKRQKEIKQLTDEATATLRTVLSENPSIATNVCGRIRSARLVHIGRADRMQHANGFLLVPYHRDPDANIAVEVGESTLSIQTIAPDQLQTQACVLAVRRTHQQPWGIVWAQDELPNEEIVSILRMLRAPLATVRYLASAMGACS